MKLILIYCLLIGFSQSSLFGQRIRNGKQQLEASNIKNDSLICLVFESGFNKEKILIHSSDEGIILDSVLTTTAQLGLAIKIWVKKSLLPIVVKCYGKEYRIENPLRKFVYIRTRGKRDLIIEYSNSRKSYM